ncbi:MAG TPA: hypothetical protein VFN56_00795 [Candidatus Saccharimonadales bacterium]|nr:hypothetical protein [Candidatus Saccharimonadales bacterium]
MQPQKNPVTPRIAFIIQAITITIGFLILGVGIWLFYLSTRQVGSGHTSVQTYSRTFTVAKIVIASVLCGPIIAHLQRKYGEQRARKWLIMGAAVLILFGLVIALLNVRHTTSSVITAHTLTHN